MDTIEHFTTRHIGDSQAGVLAGRMKLHTDEQGFFLIDITCDNGDGAGLYLDKDARKELISILLKTL